MASKEEIIDQLQVLNALISNSHATLSSPENKQLRELHAEVTSNLKKKFPYNPMDRTFEAF